MMANYTCWIAEKGLDATPPLATPPPPAPAAPAPPRPLVTSRGPPPAEIPGEVPDADRDLMFGRGSSSVDGSETFLGQPKPRFLKILH